MGPPQETGPGGWMRASATAISELDQLLSELQGDPAPLESARLTAIAEKLAQAFAVKADEVAILAIVGKGKFLQFVIPEKLKAVGTIPLNSTAALAARTARDKRADLENAFAGARHASVFEGVPLGRGQDEMIQKIMSAPILHDGKVAGVIQISRKGHNAQGSGPDFNAEDLKKLKNLAPKLFPIVGPLQDK